MDNSNPSELDDWDKTTPVWTPFRHQAPGTKAVPIR